MTNNPFTDIQSELSEIKATLSLLVAQKTIATSSPVPNSLDDYVPVKDIIGKYCSKPTFYKHVHDGLIVLHKLGRRSFVKKSEFEQSFHKISIGAGGPAKYSC